MDKNIESGNTGNTKRTIKKHKKENGSFTQETIVKKDGKTVEHTVDINSDNASVLTVKLLESLLLSNKNIIHMLNKILLQLIESNYYQSFLEEIDSKDKNIVDYFKSKGIELKEMENGRPE